MPAVADAEVAQCQVVGVEHAPECAGLRERHDAGRGTPSGELDRVTGAQPERRAHLRMHPHDASAGVERGGPQACGESQRGRDHGHEPIAQLDHSRAAYGGGMPLPTRLRRALPRPRLNRRRVLAASVVLLLVAGLVGWAVWPRPASYTVEDATITVRSGPADDQEIRLDTRLYLPKAATDAEDLADLGYAVLTWTAQGFGRSSGQIHLDSPDWEVKDASRLVDWLAARPEIAQQAVGDPRVAAVGGSYGGALALLLAAYDRRVDAIVPMITWNDLANSFLHAAPAGRA